MTPLKTMLLPRNDGFPATQIGDEFDTNESVVPVGK